jgi:hypothetical protein
VAVGSVLETERSEREEAERNRHAVLLAIVGAVVTTATLGFMALAQLGDWVAAIGIGGLIVFVGISIGGLLGFLFSVPRILAKDNPPPAPAAKETASRTKAAAVNTALKRERLLGSNTNLERISEWLTTMLVGVGLTQIGSLDRAFNQFSEFLSNKAQVFIIDGQASAGALPAVGPFLLVCGLVSGFIFFYIYTRIYLSPLFQYVEIRLSEEIGDLPLKTDVPDFKDAAAMIGEASMSVPMAYTSVADELSINDSLEIIKNVLYQPQGYRNAITLGNKLVKTPAVKIAYYWYLMAAAYGQKFHALRGAGAPEGEQRLARLAVLDAARKAVRLNSNFKTALAELADAASYDNDLQDFADDKDFKAIVR